jgi:hypothetical protein
MPRWIIESPTPGPRGLTVAAFSPAPQSSQFAFNIPVEPVCSDLALLLSLLTGNIGN